MTFNKMPKKQTKRKRSFPPLFLNTFMLGSTCIKIRVSELTSESSEARGTSEQVNRANARGTASELRSANGTASELKSTLVLLQLEIYYSSKNTAVKRAKSSKCGSERASESSERERNGERASESSECERNGVRSEEHHLGDPLGGASEQVNRANARGTACDLRTAT